jgi:putative Mg2+ transporter-C (MgtC) family protein
MNVLSHQDVLIRLLLAAFLGSVIGFERERLLWAAGIRTHMVVCVGACLIMIVSAFGFGDSLTSQNVVLDPSRVAAQVVSGIGFLGAGAILARGEIVRGLTTAASVWTVAAIGLAVGGGLYFAAGVSTAVIIVILAGIKPIEEAYRARNQSCRLFADASPDAEGRWTVYVPTDRYGKEVAETENKAKKKLVSHRNRRLQCDASLMAGPFRAQPR